MSCIIHNTSPDNVRLNVVCVAESYRVRAGEVNVLEHAWRKYG